MQDTEDDRGQCTQVRVRLNADCCRRSHRKIDDVALKDRIERSRGSRGRSGRHCPVVGIRGHAALGEDCWYRVVHGPGNLAPLLCTLEVLLPVGIHHDVGCALLPASSGLDEPLVERDAYALDLLVAVLVHHVLVLLLGALLCGGVSGDLLDLDLDVRLDLDLRRLAGPPPVDPGPDLVAGRVEDLDSLVTLVALPRPQGALPAAEARDLGLGQAQLVEGLE